MFRLSQRSHYQAVHRIIKKKIWAAKAKITSGRSPPPHESIIISAATLRPRNRGAENCLFSGERNAFRKIYILFGTFAVPYFYAYRALRIQRWSYIYRRCRHNKHVLSQNYPYTNLDRSIEPQEFEAARISRKLHTNMTLNIGHLYSQKTSLVVISVRGWVDPRAIMRPRGLCLRLFSSNFVTYAIFRE
jgi:hypothetical protein